MAQKLFGKWGSAGGHKSAARAEIPLDEIGKETKGRLKPENFVLKHLKRIK
jgi:nanoRNase/pAp phosphatase (c-di-AMP/oligoRNAs hydrolase)